MKDNRVDYYDAFREGVSPEVRVRGGSAQNGWVTGSRGGQQVVYQAGKPVLDRDLNLSTEALREQLATLLGLGQGASGFVGAGVDPREDFHTGEVPVGFVDTTGTHTERGRLKNAFLLPALDLLVAGEPVRIELTHTSTPGWNLVPLRPPTVYDGTPKTVKRSDFVFVELWRALIAPAGRASGRIEILSAPDVGVGDRIEIGPYVLVAGTDFVLDPDPDRLAQNIVKGSQNPTWPGRGELTLRAVGSEVEVYATPGEAGNLLSLQVVVAVMGAMRASGAFLTGGYDQPNRPSPTTLYRYGNVLSPVSISDELLDPTGQETCLRVQWQYRIRVTGEEEAVSFEAHPEGFGSISGGTVPSIFAQGGRSLPVWSGNGVDSRSYPFCPADGEAVWGSSSARAYGEVDPALWVAGRGSEESARDLGAVDGFVYAVPIGFVFRRNDASGARLGFSAWENQNGGVSMSHSGFTAPDGLVVPAGVSDRPDGGFSDLIGPGDLLDLRPQIGAIPSGFLDMEVARLLQRETRSWASDGTALQGLTGMAGVEYLLMEEVGRVAGTPPSSGQTGMGRCVSNFDHLARTFSTRPTSERVCLAVWPGSRPTRTAQGGPVGRGVVNPALYVVKAEKSPGVPIDPAGWTAGDQIHLDLTEWDLSTLGGVFSGGTGDGESGPGLKFLNLVPPGTHLSDLLSCEHDEGNSAVRVDRTVLLGACEGVGANHVALTLLPNPIEVDSEKVCPLVGERTGSERRIFVEVEVTYPGRGGTFQTPARQVEPDPIWDGTYRGPGPLVELDRTQRPADMETLLPPHEGGGREIRIEYVGNGTSRHAKPTPALPLTEEVVGRARQEIVLPRRVWRGLPPTVKEKITGRVIAVDDLATPWGSSDRIVRLSGSTGGEQVICEVTYMAQDPVPNYGATGYQVGVFYQTAATQTAGTRAGTGYLPQKIELELVEQGSMWLAQGGVGSPEADRLELSPDLIPLRDGAPFGAGVGEEVVGASGVISTGGVSAPVGSFRVPTRYPIRTGTRILLGGDRPGEGPQRDREGRAFYPIATASGRDLFGLAEALSGPARHKALLPLLCRTIGEVRTPTGGVLWRAQTYVLVVLSRYAELDPFAVVGPGERFSASLYRVAGNRIGTFRKDK